MQLSQLDYINAMTYTREIKWRHQKYARDYARDHNNSLLLKIVKDGWKKIPTFLYENVNGDLETNKKLVLASMIAERYLIKRYTGKLKHVSIALVGLAGSGKTTYALRSSIGALMIAGYDYETARSIASKLIFFEPMSLIDFITELLKNKKWAPFIIIDDIGSQISKYWVLLGQHYWSHLFSVLDQLKDIVGVLITTARKFTSIPNRIREITDIIADFQELDIESYVVDRIEYYLLDDYTTSSKKKREKMLYLDAIPPTAKMPDDVWEAMMESRRAVGIKRLTDIKRLMEMSREKFEEKISKQVNMEGDEAIAGNG